MSAASEVIVSSNLCHSCADIVDGNDQTPLPVEIGFVLLGQALGNRQALLVSVQRLRELALDHQHFALLTRN